jgi:ASC-1-like (ASCH) protein
MSDLVLHLKTRYFRQIKDGTKSFEYRLVKPYWEKRLVGRQYDRVVFWDAYKPRSSETVIIRPYRGFERQTITHPHFGPDPVKVFAIRAEEQRDPHDARERT